MTTRSTIIAGVVLISASALLLTGCAGRTAAEPAAATRVTDRSCTVSTAKAQYYATHPSQVKSTTSASCVLKYLNTVNLSKGLTNSVTARYTASDDHEYGDAGGDGIVTKTYESTFSTTTKQALETYHLYDELGDLNSGAGTDTVRVRYLDKSKGAVYTNTPTADQGWAKTTASYDARHLVLDHAGLFPSSGLTITSWTKAAANGRNTWTFALGSKLDGGTITAVVASNGQVLSVDSSIHYDGGQHAERTTLTATYGGGVKHVTIPDAVTKAVAAR